MPAENDASTPFDEQRLERLRIVTVDDEYGAHVQVELATMDASDVQLIGQATNGRAGAELVEREQPDLVLLDLNMPVMDGFETIPLIRRISPHTRILVWSNYERAEVEPVALELGAHRFVSKFAAPEALLTAIRETGRPEVPKAVRTIFRAHLPRPMRRPGAPGFRQVSRR